MSNSTTSTARRKSKGASALGGSADLKQLAFKSQKSKVLWNKLFNDFQWSAYLRTILDIDAIATTINRTSMRCIKGLPIK